MQLLQEMLLIGNLTAFIDELGAIILNEKIDRQRWDYWLHRVFDMDFAEYVEACEINMKQSKTSDVELKEIIKENYKMMEEFIP